MSLSKVTTLRPDLQRVADWVAPGSRVLDLGCSSGELLAYLQNEKGCSVLGVDIDDNAVLATMQRGVNVLQLDLESGLAMFKDQAFDVVLQLQTLQQMRRVETILAEIARVGQQAIVSVTNFGYWQHRLQLLAGRMPVSQALPYGWYDTPNIRCATLQDFADYVTEHGFTVEQQLALVGEREVHWLPNLRGEIALFKLQKR